MKYWELIAGGISKVRWGLGYVLAVDSEGERSGLLTHIAATGKRFVVHSEEKLTAFVELESQPHRGRPSCVCSASAGS
jgi:hypothetical protein